MKNLAFLFAIMLLMASCQPNKATFDDAVCIENISTIDPVDGLKEHQTVVIKDGRILKISATADLLLSPENTIVDGTGKYLIPGLWDAHVHFAYMEEMAPRMLDLFLVYGITSVRDTGGKIDFVKKWQNEAMARPTSAPRVKIAGPLLDGLPNVYDGSDPGHPQLSVGLGSVEAVTAEINKLDSIGVDLLKAYEMLTPEQFGAVMTKSKEFGYKVTGHVPLSMDVMTASNNGLSSMEHLRNLELSCASNAAELLAERRRLLTEGSADPGGILRTRIHQAQREIAVQNYDEKVADEVIATLVKNDTWQIPTMALNTGFIEKPFATEDYQTSFQYLSDTTEATWKAGIGVMMGREVTPFQQEYYDWMLQMVAKLNKAGVNFMAGTDCPIFFQTPGRSLHQELVMLQKSGLTPLEVIRTATINPAKYFDLDSELGSIKENMWADLLILDANPLEDIRNTLKINTVIKEGAFHDSAKLDELKKNLL